MHGTDVADGTDCAMSTIKRSVPHSGFPSTSVTELPGNSSWTICEPRAQPRERSCDQGDSFHAPPL
jgi:hypothetical protein